jgi:hypothetical protein
VDGNIIRVLSRIFGVEGDMRRAAPKTRIWQLATELVPRRRPGRFNQAMMELGALVCTPRSPCCSRCPVKRDCVAHAEDRVAELPQLGAKRPPKSVHYVAAVVRRQGQGDLLLAKRHDEGLFGGLWEPPMVPRERDVKRALKRLGVHGRGLRDGGHIAHVLSHRIFEVDVLQSRPKTAWPLPAPPTGPYERLGWHQAADVPLSTLAKKLLQIVPAMALMTLAVGFSAPAYAQSGEATAANAPERDTDRLREKDLDLYRRLSMPRGRYGRILGTLAFGRGFRFNNPFRLGTQLASSGESVSLAAPYVDGGLGLTFGNPHGIQHGGSLRLSASLDGVRQQAVGISYLGVYRGDAPLMGLARLGVSVLTAPDPNVGGELAVGFAWFFTGALGVHAEVVGGLYYGAGTYETVYSVIPLMSGQAGLIIDYEVLP